jgi:hypothetical protein
MKLNFIRPHNFALALLLTGAMPLHAATIVSGESTPGKAQLSSASVKIHHEFKITYQQDDHLTCSAVLTFSDGSPDQNVVIYPPLNNIAIDKTYIAGGFFQASLSGKPHNGWQGCAGAQSASVAIEDVRPKASAIPVVQPAITGLVASGGSKPGEPTTVKVLGHGQCKYHVDFGDGRSTDREDMLPTNLEPGYSISSYGNKTFKMAVTGAAGKCQGTMSASVTVMGPGVPAAGSGPGNSGNTAVLASPTKVDLKPVCPPGKRC